MAYLRYSKYRAKKVTIDGITFDSKKEAKRYQELKLMEASGIITGLERQVKFVLIPQQRAKDSIKISNKGKATTVKGKVLERECAYIADFTYYQDGKYVVEDVKGIKKGAAYTVFTIKRKLMLFIHGIQIKEV